MNAMKAMASEVELLAQADALMLLADVLREPAAVDADDDWQALLHAAGWADDAALQAAWAQLRQQIAQADVQDWSREHHRLFEGAIACPPNETAYIRRDKGAILGDLCGFYNAFNLTPAQTSGEKPDHIVTELQFLSLLLVMIAQAQRGGQAEQQQVAADAAALFARDHLADWLPMLIAQLRLTSGMLLYRALADVLEQTWAALARQHDWPALVQPQELNLAFDVEAPAEECGQINDPVPLRVEGRPLTQTGDQP